MEQKANLILEYLLFENQFPHFQVFIHCMRRRPLFGQESKSKKAVDAEKVGEGLSECCQIIFGDCHSPLLFLSS